jgi:hypothetical protein
VFIHRSHSQVLAQRIALRDHSIVVRGVEPLSESGSITTTR